MNRPPTASESHRHVQEHQIVSGEDWVSTSSQPPEVKETNMLTKLRWTVLGLLIVLPVIGGIVGIKALQFRAMGAAAAQMVIPPEPVNVIEVREEDWHPRVSAVGTVTAVQGTVIRTEADGLVREIKFEPGSTVTAGDELVQLDIELENAQLRAAEAAAELARLSYARAKELFATKSISQAEYDAADATLKQTQAQVDNIRALIAKKTIRAPFGGKLGIQNISVGQYLDKGSPVVSLQSLDPVYAEFSVPQQRLGDLAEGLKAGVTTDAYPGEEFNGTVTAVNPQVDSSTRNVRVQATLANPDGRLRPGMFVAVDVVLATSQKSLFIPATAVHHAPFGDSIFVVAEGEPGPDGSKPMIVQQRHVRLGERQGDFVVLLEGARKGETIVSTGVFKLRPGMTVVVDNALAPEFSFTPKTKNT